ncbi:putative calcium ion P-type ATPase [Catenaria anguillulae PL171]|uniref:Calcium-transporting ATPase n=1 Tax=Catenaria anguillulae PL171 TaxID=765915 RepID=A0A1Y2HA37_9FUNG|nr:putative calcium ion P-type ATPase [Catenaria anguillulae PL171]
MDDSFLHSPDQVLAHFRVDPSKGLTDAQIATQRKKHGLNELPEDPPTPLWKLILEQFQDQLVIILLLAAIVSFVLAVLEYQEEGGHASGADGGIVTAFVEPLVILLILIANAAVGVVQESNAEKAIEALKEYSPDEAKVLRGGHVHRIPAKELVPGDIIELAVGDKIPADARLLSIQSSTFRVDQAVLTGESVSVTKELAAIKDKDAVNQDKINTIFSGTTITLGKARAIVTESERSPLKKKLDEFGDWLAKMITVVCVLVWVINIRHFNDPLHHGWLKGAVYYFKIAVALAVAAIPEGLAVMAKKNAIVRSLPSVETLGCTSVICSDKTGTLTTNQMSVCDLVTVRDASGQLAHYSIDGTSFAPYGSVFDAETDAPITDYSLPSASPAIKDLALVCAQCNDASIAYEANDEFIAIGEPTDAALKVLVEKIGAPDTAFNRKLDSLDKEDRAMAVNEWYESAFERVKAFEFSRDRKSMSVVVRSPSTQQYHLLVKGAPESILDRCTNVKLASGAVVPLTPALRESLMDKYADLARARALRVLGCAITPVDAHGEWTRVTDPAKYVTVEHDLTFLGLTGMMDPPRPQVRNAISLCHRAGIRVIVITGDNKNTAEAICRQIGVFSDDVDDLRGLSYTGREWDAMPMDQKRKAITRANLFSRVEPTHKQELVDLLQSMGQVVAMTGDGVNDAPALKKADIGVAMGSGTDVAKLAADMVLADDDFSTIVAAVEEGRSIYNNTKQFIRYLISSNIGEVVAIFLTVILGMPEALIPVQLLWVNLVTDGLPATALGFNPPDPDIMWRPPRKASEPIVGRWLFFRYLVIGTYVGAAPEFPKRATTVSLSVLVVIEMFNAMNSLSENASLFQMPLWRNWTLIGAITLSMILHFVVLYWMAVLAISAPILLIDEVLKWVSRAYVTEYAVSGATIVRSPPASPVKAGKRAGSPARANGTTAATVTGVATPPRTATKRQTAGAGGEYSSVDEDASPVAARTRSRLRADGSTSSTGSSPGNSPARAAGMRRRD